MKILITGGTGFVGQHVAELYLRAGHQVYITGREAPIPGTEYLGRDFQQLDFDKLPRFEILNHQAAITDPQHPDQAEVFQVNFLDSIALFQRAAQHGVRRIVYASSAAVYGNLRPPFREAGPFKPLTAYGVSKLTLDKMAPELVPSTVSLVGLRYSNVYGPGEAHKGKLASMVRQIGFGMLKGERPRLYPNGQQRRDFVHVEDVARANYMAARCVGRGEVFNVGAGYNLSFNEVVQVWNTTLQTDLKPEWIPNPYADTYQNETVLDIEKAKLIGWKPEVSFGQGVAKYRGQMRSMHGRRGNHP